MIVRACLGVLTWGLLVLAPQGARALPSVSFDIADTDIQVGETFTVEIVVDGVDPLDEVISFGFDVDFDLAWTETVAPLIGPVFIDDSALFPGTDVAGSVFPGPGPSGNGIFLATLSFVSASAGVFDLGIVSDLLDLNEGLFTLSSSDRYDLSHSERITVNMPVNENPEPHTLALMALGMAGLRYRCRRKPA